MKVQEACSELGIEVGADAATLKLAYRRLARETRPDMIGQDPVLVDRFIRGKLAYEYLVANGTSPPSLFGGETPRRGRDISITLEVSIADLLGRSDVMVPPGSPVCTVCDGSGRVPSRAPVRCPDCNGQGHVIRYFGTMSTRTRCESCHGTGEVSTCPCTACGGSGKNPIGVRPPSLRLERGTRDGDQVVIQGAGVPGIGGGAAGDLRLTISVRPDPRVKLHGDDALLRIRRPVSDFVRGAEFEIQGLESRERYRVSLPSGSSGRTHVMVPGAGLPRRDGTRGNIVALVEPAPVEPGDRRGGERP